MIKLKNITGKFVIAFSLLTLLSSCGGNNLAGSDQLYFSVRSLNSDFFFIPNQVNDSIYTQPEYSDLDLFSEKQVRIGKGEWSLPATLTIPRGNGPFPVVVLVHGAGPNDMDESLGPNKPFRDIAWGLASHQIATLRYDKRSRVYPDKMNSLKDGFTVKEEIVDDALEAVSYLKTAAGIDPKRIFIAGHDLGGMIAPRIAAADTDIAGLIIMAGNSRPLEDVLLQQSLYNISNKENVSNFEKKQHELFQIKVNNVKSLSLSLATEPKTLPYNIPAKYWLDLKNYNPGLTAKNLNKPVLILQGEKDNQVTMEDFALWKQSQGLNHKFKFQSYPNLNHIFLETDEKENNLLPGHISISLLLDIIFWLKRF